MREASVNSDEGREKDYGAKDYLIWSKINVEGRYIYKSIYLVWQ